MAQEFLNNLMRNQQSNFVNLITHSVLYEVYMILEDCHKQLRKIALERMSKSLKRQTKKQKTQNFGFKSYDINQSRSQGRDLTAYEELKQPLLDDQDNSQGMSTSNMIPEGLGSQHFHRMMMSKLKILKNTIDIIEESLEAIKIASSFTLISHQAQVMIDAYKDAESSEGLMYYLGQRRSQTNDEENNESSNSNSSNNSSFNLRTLNLNELKAQQLVQEKQKHSEFNPGGDQISMNLLYAQAFLYNLNHFAIVPCIFEYATQLDQTPLFAGILLAMTPLATSMHAIIQNLWTKLSFKHPLLFGQLMIILSNAFYINAYYEHSIFYLILSRFLFGFGGSKVVHRKYIANYVQKQYWTQYYSKLIFISFLGMCFGPLIFLALVYLNMTFIHQERDFLIPGYFGLFIFICFTLVLLVFFRRTSIIQNETRPRTRSQGFLFKTNTTSKYSLDSDESDQEKVKQTQLNQISEEVELNHYNQKLKEITELQGFWQKYGSYIIIIILKFMQKVTQDSLIVILPILIAISTSQALPLTFPSLSYVCFIYSAMGIIALFVNMIVQRLDLQYQDRSILLASLFATSFGLFFSIDLVNQGSLILHMFGFGITFIGIEIMEVAIAALTAKFTPPNLQRGNLNPSFLLTFAGTIGRAVGCLIITLTDLGITDQSELDHVTNYTFIPMLAIYLMLFLVTNCIYDQLKNFSFYQYQLLDRIKRQEQQQSAQNFNFRRDSSGKIPNTILISSRY